MTANVLLPKKIILRIQNAERSFILYYQLHIAYYKLSYLKIILVEAMSLKK